MESKFKRRTGKIICASEIRRGSDLFTTPSFFYMSLKSISRGKISYLSPDSEKYGFYADPVIKKAFGYIT